MALNSKDKGELRKYWKSEYPNFRSFFSVWSQAICRHVLSHPDFKKAKKIGIFYPREWEVNLIPIWEARPLDCLLPKTERPSWEMKFYSVEALEVPYLVLGPGGVWEPVDDKTRAMNEFGATDIILIPGLVFDSRGMRVGSGKGVYDRFLSTVGRAAKKWGVAFSPQVISDPIDCEPQDVLIEALITEKGFVYF
ncbi:MAG: 5-formyltetrahydrofolate cyclo-ligase [Proteobacteria bacterium]|nr:5-formyltetrahydrofolate cyclo-ligase [Pseudomonadota bacterium]NBY19460.1 5-formyltetrahydrofolate cyclo-ligase [bacterium]